MEINKDLKPQHDYEFMKNLIDQDMSVKQISNMLNVSKHLVELKLKEFKLK